MTPKLFPMFVLLLALPFPAAADILPPAPQPPPPDGPAEALVRGITFEQTYTYWRGRRWQVRVAGCAEGETLCDERKIVGCLVTRLDGAPVPDGSVATLAAAGTNETPLTITLEGCPASGDLVLEPDATETSVD